MFNFLPITEHTGIIKYVDFAKVLANFEWEYCEVIIKGLKKESNIWGMALRAMARAAVRGLSPSRDGARDDGPLVAADGVRRENLRVLLLRELPALHGRIELVAPTERRKQ